MSYDWKDRVVEQKFSAQWFDEIDRRFVHGARLFAHDVTPFDRIIPYDQLRGKRVLEIGCGMGYHSELMLRAGAVLTSIDISDTSVTATQARLSQRALAGDVQQMDARDLKFTDASFDFVWSWGVIHHSTQTGLIVKEIHRVLKPGGEARIMVYNLNSMGAYVTIVLDYLTGFWRGRTLDECLWRRSDGYMARYYSSDMLCDIMRIFFPQVTAQIFGQDADAVPLPRRLRAPVMRMMSTARLEALAGKRGSFLFVSVVK